LTSLISLSLGSSGGAPVPPPGVRVYSSEGVPVFQACLLESRRFWPSLLASVVLHVLCLLCLPVLIAQLSMRSEGMPAVELVSGQPVYLRVPEQLFLPSPKPQSPSPPAAPKPAARAAGTRPKSESETKEPSLREPARRRFELPPLPKRTEVELTVLQPQFPPDLPPPRQMKLPDIVFWAAMELPPPPPKPFVLPGRRTPVTPPPMLDAPPKLDLPNQEPNVSDLKIPSVLAANIEAKLTLPPATTAPIRAFIPPSPSESRPEQSMDLDPFPGDPVTLLATNRVPKPLDTSLIVLPGNQLGALPPPGFGTGGAGGLSEQADGGGDGEGEATSRGAAADGGGDDGRGEGAGSGGSEGGTSGAGSSAGAIGGGEGDGAGNAPGRGQGSPEGSFLPGSQGSGPADSPGRFSRGQDLAMLGAPRPALSSSSVPTRVIHPETGVFDVVVVQPSPLDGLIESSGLLSGRPVYTVYLNVGAPKEWTMQYCVPNDNLQTSANTIQLGNPAPVKAPFPRVTLLPPADFLPKTARTILHGFLNDTGLFEELRAVSTEDGDVGALLAPFLHEWEFRPATRDGVPIEIEILLVVPPSTPLSR
jgi:hypothetical protein